MRLVIGFVVGNGFDFVWWGFSVTFVAHGAREARRRVCGRGLSAFVAREARRGVWDSGVCGGKWTPAPALAP